MGKLTVSLRHEYPVNKAKKVLFHTQKIFLRLVKLIIKAKQFLFRRTFPFPYK